MLLTMLQREWTYGGQPLDELGDDTPIARCDSFASLWFAAASHTLPVLYLPALKQPLSGKPLITSESSSMLLGA